MKTKLFWLQGTFYHFFYKEGSSTHGVHFGKEKTAGNAEMVLVLRRRQSLGMRTSVALLP